MTPHEPADDDVLAAYRQLCQALVEQPVDQLDELLADGYTATHITGYTAPKTEWPQQIQNGKFTYHAITDDTTDVEIHGDRATTVSTALYRVTLNGHPGRCRLRSTLDWALIDGRWRAVNGRAALA